MSPCYPGKGLEEEKISLRAVAGKFWSSNDALHNRFVIVTSSDLTISPNELSKQNTIEEFLLDTRFGYLMNGHEERIGQTQGIF